MSLKLFYVRFWGLEVRKGSLFSRDGDSLFETSSMSRPTPPSVKVSRKIKGILGVPGTGGDRTDVLLTEGRRCGPRVTYSGSNGPVLSTSFPTCPLRSTPVPSSLPSTPIRTEGTLVEDFPTPDVVPVTRKVRPPLTSEVSERCPWIRGPRMCSLTFPSLLGTTQFRVITFWMVGS